MKVSVSNVTKNEKSQWMVSYRPAGGKRVRHFHDTQVAALEERKAVQGQAKDAGAVWMNYPANTRAEIISVVGEAQQRGFGLREAFDFYQTHHDLAPHLPEFRNLLLESRRAGFTLRAAFDYYRTNKIVAQSNMTVQEAYDAWMVELTAQGVDGKSMTAYESNVGRFVAKHKDRTLPSISRGEAMAWLSAWTGSTFNTYRTSLNTFFKWCVDTKKILDSPTATIKKIKRERLPTFDKPPGTLNLLQTAKLLQATLQSEPGLIPYVAAGLFGGLRPDKEAAQLLATDVRKDDTIHVRGSHAKDRQQRYVNMEHRLKTNGQEERISTLKQWMELGGDFGRPVTDNKGRTVVEKPVNFRRRWEEARAAAGLIKQVKEKGKKRKQIVFTGWDQDCLRHTFASNFLPLFGVEETMKQLGHGDYGMLFAHYRALVTERDARKYWTLTPEFIKAGKFASLRSKPRPAGAH